MEAVAPMARLVVNTKGGCLVDLVTLPTKIKEGGSQRIAVNVHMLRPNLSHARARYRYLHRAWVSDAELNDWAGGDIVDGKGQDDVCVLGCVYARTWVRGCGEPGHDVEPGGAKGSEVEDEVEEVDVERSQADRPGWYRAHTSPFCVVGQSTTRHVSTANEVVDASTEC